MGDDISRESGARCITGTTILPIQTKFAHGDLLCPDGVHVARRWAGAAVELDVDLFWNTPPAWSELLLCKTELGAVIGDTGYSRRDAVEPCADAVVVLEESVVLDNKAVCVSVE